MSAQSISKIEAASRQLDLAIRLYFEDADVIGIHTLGGAAHGILQDLLARSVTSNRGSIPQTKVHQSQHKYLVKMVRAAIGFLKHADRDAKRMLRFNPNWTDFLLYEAIEMHIRVTRDITHANAIFLVWVTCKYPTVHLFDESLGEGLNELRRLLSSLGEAGTRKRLFLKALERRPNPL